MQGILKLSPTAALHGDITAWLIIHQSRRSSDWPIFLGLVFTAGPVKGGQAPVAAGMAGWVEDVSGRLQLLSCLYRYPVAAGLERGR